MTGWETYLESASIVSDARAWLEANTDTATGPADLTDTEAVDRYIDEAPADDVDAAYDEWIADGRERAMEARR